MKYIVILAAVAVVGVLLVSNMSSTSTNDVLFQQFITEHSRNYATVEEYDMRMTIFSEQIKKADEHNKQGKGWTMGVNQYSDWTDEEYQKLLGLKNFRNANINMPLAPLKVDPVNTDKDIDWRNYPGFVGPVLNQGKCGSCWAFSAAQAVAAAYFKSYQEVVDVSRSHAVDCDFFSHGCNGGLQENAYIHWMRHSF
jgi:C1A family cysteine protease